jgi:hypothetical protein
VGAEIDVLNDGRLAQPGLAQAAGSSCPPLSRGQALTQFRDAQLQRAEPGVEGPVAVAVAPSRALAAALVSARRRSPLDIGFH